MDDSRLRIVLLGGKGVGKTAILRKYIEPGQSMEVQPTVVVDWFMVPVPRSSLVVQFVDLSHAELTGPHLATHLRDAVAIVLVADLTSWASLEVRYYP